MLRVNECAPTWCQVLQNMVFEYLQVYFFLAALKDSTTDLELPIASRLHLKPGLLQHLKCSKERLPKVSIIFISPNQV